MPKERQSEEQMIVALQQSEAGGKTVDICRKLGVCQATFYLWKKQYAGLGVQELRELRSLRTTEADRGGSDAGPAILREKI